MSNIIFGPFRLLGNAHLFNWLFRWPVHVDVVHFSDWGAVLHVSLLSAHTQLLSFPRNFATFSGMYLSRIHDSNDNDDMPLIVFMVLVHHQYRHPGYKNTAATSLKRDKWF